MTRETSAVMPAGVNTFPAVVRIGVPTMSVASRTSERMSDSRSVAAADSVPPLMLARHLQRRIQIQLGNECECCHSHAIGVYGVRIKGVGTRE